MKLDSLYSPLGLLPLALVLSHCSSDEGADNNGSTMTSSATMSSNSATMSNTSMTSTVSSTSTSTSTMTSTATMTSSSSSGGAGGATTTGTASGGMGGSGGASSTGVDMSSSGGGMGGSGGTNTGGMFTLTSSELDDGAAMLPKHTCAMAGFGNDESPPLAWTGVPPNTMSFALIFVDTTLIPGNQNGYHWAIWDIPPSITELPANLPACSMVTAPLSCEEYAPSIGNGGYLGPCPNVGGGSMTDNYEFRLYAMPTATAAESGVTGTMLNTAMVEAFEQAALETAVLHATSDAAPGP